MITDDVCRVWRAKLFKGWMLLPSTFSIQISQVVKTNKATDEHIIKHEVCLDDINGMGLIVSSRLGSGNLLGRRKPIHNFNTRDLNGLI